MLPNRDRYPSTFFEKGESLGLGHIDTSKKLSIPLEPSKVVLLGRAGVIRVQYGKCDAWLVLSLAVRSIHATCKKKFRRLADKAIHTIPFRIRFDVA